MAESDRSRDEARDLMNAIKELEAGKQQWKDNYEEESAKVSKLERL